MGSLIVWLVLLSLAYRISFALAALFPRRAQPAPNKAPSVQILVAARNEEARLPAFLEALDALAYEAGELNFVFADDGSADATPCLLEEWRRGHPRARVVRLEKGEGKSGALRRAWEQAPGAELTVLFDADVLPAPDALALLAAEFSDPRIGAVSGAVEPLDSGSGFAARYAACELWVFHKVIQPARDRLGLNPPAIGAHRAFRTSALAELPAFPSVPSLAEDLETSAALVRAGWRTRFQRKAVVRTQVPATIREFLEQRRRWATGVFWSAMHQPGWASALDAVGYLERGVVAALLAGIATGLVAGWWLPVYLAGPGLHLAIALRRARVERPLRHLAAAVFMFLLDVAVTSQAFLRSLRLFTRNLPETPWR